MIIPSQPVEEIPEYARTATKYDKLTLIIISFICILVGLCPVTIATFDLVKKFVSTSSLELADIIMFAGGCFCGGVFILMGIIVLLTKSIAGRIVRK